MCKNCYQNTKFCPSVTKKYHFMFSLPKPSLPSSTTLPSLYQVVQNTLKTILNKNAFEISWCKTEKVWKVYFSKTIEWQEKEKWKFNTFEKSIMPAYAQNASNWIYRFEINQQMAWNTVQCTGIMKNLFAYFNRDHCIACLYGCFVQCSCSVLCYAFYMRERALASFIRWKECAL